MRVRKDPLLVASKYGRSWGHLAASSNCFSFAEGRGRHLAKEMGNDGLIRNRSGMGTCEQQQGRWRRGGGRA